MGFVWGFTGAAKILKCAAKQEPQSRHQRHVRPRLGRWLDFDERQVLGQAVVGSSRGALADAKGCLFRQQTPRKFGSMTEKRTIRSLNGEAQSVSPMVRVELVEQGTLLHPVARLISEHARKITVVFQTIDPIAFDYQRIL